MDVGQTSQGGRGKNKRSWTKLEEEHLIDGLLELNSDPQWKADGSFKNGFKNKLEDMMNKKFPGCGLKANPHIESKIKWFKDKYNALTEMFRTSGFSWDDEKHMIKCERQSYDDFCRQNKNAHGLWNVSFPHFDKLAIIYGPGQATGTYSETFAEAVENQQNEPIDLSKDESDEDDLIDDNESLYRPTQSSPSEPTSKKAKTLKIQTENTKQKTKKRKMPDVVDLTTSFKDMSSNLSDFMSGMNVHMSTIANALSTTQQHEHAIMVREQELENQKKNLVNELLGMQGLTRYEALLASKKLASSPSDLSLSFIRVQMMHGRRSLFLTSFTHTCLVMTIIDACDV
ncbi:uncharacterized protein LOC141602172 [Silene latifolia]|uniref:uncharacterized protein LOC141602172 n=1 Tax=Silene latifolia TaxID=37657 RepID=UPI003D789040